MNSPDKQCVSLKLSKDESLVLFDFISRFSQNDQLEIIDESEKIALNNLLCSLEKVLEEPFDPSYALLLEKSRKQLRLMYSDDA